MKLDAMLNGLLNTTKAKEDGRKANARDRYHARRIASKLGIEITRDHMSEGYGYTIEYHIDQVGPQGWTDDLFSTSWEEVREKLETIEVEREG